MGHLINPIAMRMGWSSNWVDVFFSDFKYYPFYLHLIFRLRLMLITLFNSKWFEGAAFFYSHFLLVKTYNGLQVKIYFYDGICESYNFFLRDTIREDKQTLRNLTTWRTFHEKKKRKFWTFYLFLIVFYMVNKFRIFDFPALYLKHNGSVALSKAFFKRDTNALLTVLKLNTEVKNEKSELELEEEKYVESGKLPKPSTEKKRLQQLRRSHRFQEFREERNQVIDKLLFFKTRLRLFFFYAICRTLALQDYEDSGFSLAPVDMLKKFIFSLFALTRNNFIFSVVRQGLHFLFNYLCAKDNARFVEYCYVNFYIISNEHITAKFISRYVARKLQQGFTIRSLMNPLSREFKRLGVMGTFTDARILNLFETFATRTANATYFSSLFRILISRLHVLYKNENYPYVQKNKTCISFDNFLFLNFAYKSLFKSGKALIVLCKKYLSCYFFLIITNYYRTFAIYRMLLEQLLASVQPLVYFNVQRFFLNYFPRIAYVIPLGSYEAYLNWEGLAPYYYKKFLLSSFLLLFNSKMHSVYGKYHRAYENYVKHKKNRLLRNIDTTKENTQGIKGFKLQFLGRFTRRQRSVKLTWRQGKLPLTNISTEIDYADYSIVLVNSLANVKVWFYKTPFFETYYSKLI